MAVFSTEVQVTNTPLPVDTTGQNITVTNPGLTDTELRATPVPVSGPLTDTELRATPVPISGSVTTTPSTATSSTVAVTTLPASTNTTILSANANRRAVIITVAKAGTHIKFGAAASASSYTYKTASANTVIESNIWTGQIDAFGPSGEIAVTELAI